MVTIFEVDQSRQTGRQIYPIPSEMFGEEEVKDVVHRANVKVCWNCGGQIHVSPTKGHGNFVHKLPVQPRPDLLERVSQIVTGWYPRQNVTVIFESPY